METNDNMKFEDKMTDYIRKWRQLSVSIPLIDIEWLKKTISQKRFELESVIDQTMIIINENNFFLFWNNFNDFNKKRITLKENWILEAEREEIGKKKIFYNNYSPQEKPFMKDRYDCAENKKYKSLWDLAVNIAYNEYKESKLLKENESLEEWKEKVKDQSSLEYSPCHKINSSLNESGVILKNLFTEMGIHFSKEFWKKIDKNDMKKMYKTIQDVYYLLKLITEYRGEHQRKWKEYDNKSSFGRSFLKEGKGGLAFFIKNNLQDKCGWNKCITQEYSIIGLLSSLFVIPKMLESELYWNSVDLKKASDIKFEFVVKEILLRNVPKENVCKRRLRSIEIFEETDYSLLDDVYWFISIRQLKDFFVMDEKKLFGIWSDFTINAIDLLTIIENMDNDDIDINDNSAIKSICIEYILKNHYGKKKENLDRQIRRGIDSYDQLYDFYKKGIKVFRNLKFYEGIFDKTCLFNMIKNKKNKISKIKKAYIKSVILIIYIVMGQKKVIPRTLTGKRLEEKYSLVEFIDLYKKETSKKEFLKNPITHFFWEFLNDRIEWGKEAKKINEFRQNIMVPYLLAYTGLRNNYDAETSLSFNEIIDALITKHSKKFLDMQIEQVQKRYERVIGERVTADFLAGILNVIKMEKN